MWSDLVESQVAALAKRACSCPADDNLIDADCRLFLLSALTPLNVPEVEIRAKKYSCPLVFEIRALGNRFKIGHCIFLLPQSIIASLRFIRQRFHLNDFGPGAQMKLRSRLSANVVEQGGQQLQSAAVVEVISEESGFESGITILFPLMPPHYRL